MGIAGAEESGQLGDIAGEGGQVVLNALIIPDDSIEMVEHRECGTFFCRYEQTCLIHQCQKSQCLNGNGLAACVGSGDDEYFVINPQRYGYRDHLFRINKRMACLFQVYLPFGRIHCTHRMHIHGQCPSGKDKFNPGRQFCIFTNRVSGLFYFSGELLQNGMNFRLFTHCCFCQIVVKLNGNHWFHVQCLSCGRPVMNNAVKLIPVFFLYRKYIAPVSLGYNIVLKIGGLISVVKYPLKRTAESGFQVFHLAAYPVQLRGSIIPDIPVFFKNPVNPAHKVIHRLHEHGQGFQGRVNHMPFPVKIMMHTAMCGKCGREVHEFLRCSRNVLFRLFQQRSHIMSFSQRCGNFFLQADCGFFRFSEPFLDNALLRRRHPFHGHFLGQTRNGTGSQHFSYFIKFQCVKNLFIHLQYTS